MKKLIDFLPIGFEVYSLMYGKGIVIDKLPLTVFFPNSGHCQKYNQSGYIDDFAVIPDLYLEPPTVSNESIT